MGALVTRRTSVRQPAGAALIDRANPLGAKVIECLPLNGQPYATVSGAKLTLTGGAFNAVKDRALALRSNGAMACGSIPLDLSAYSRITVAFWLYWDSYATETLAMEFGSTYSAVPGFIVDPGCASPPSFMFGVGNVGGSNLVTCSRPSVAAWHRVLLTLDRTAPVGSSGVAYVDGAVRAMSTFPGSTTTTGNFASDTLHLFSRNESSVFGAGSMEMLTIYDGILTAAEAAEDFQNCYQVLKAPRQRLFAFGAAAQQYRLQVASGALSLASAPARLLANRRLTATTGSLAASGEEARLAASRVLPADAGRISLSGEAAALVAARRVQVMPGAFSLAGSTAAVAVSRHLALGSGTFGISGPGPALRAARRLTASVGTFVLSPNAVQMVYQPVADPGGGLPKYTLAAAPGSFGLVGVSALLRAQRQLQAAAGAALLSGSDARLASGRRLPAESGGLSISGAPVAVMAARRIPAQAGTFDLLGLPVQLRYSAQIEYARAPAGSGYAPQRNEYQSRPATTSSPRPAATQRNLR